MSCQYPIFLTLLRQFPAISTPLFFTQDTGFYLLFYELLHNAPQRSKIRCILVFIWNKSGYRYFAAPHLVLSLYIETVVLISTILLFLNVKWSSRTLHIIFSAKIRIITQNISKSVSGFGTLYTCTAPIKGNIFSMPTKV